mmetsp:Transcript_3112/g.10901  ORF Transcript_3112/g.10901 Transcript_3112/m.10901 type:complete len:236 (-) Transcript_3112:402-1109(-)
MTRVALRLRAKSRRRRRQIESIFFSSFKKNSPSRRGAFHPSVFSFPFGFPLLLLLRDDLDSELVVFLASLRNLVVLSRLALFRAGHAQLQQLAVQHRVVVTQGIARLFQPSQLRPQGCVFGGQRIHPPSQILALGLLSQPRPPRRFPVGLLPALALVLALVHPHLAVAVAVAVAVASVRNSDGLAVRRRRSSSSSRRVLLLPHRRGFSGEAAVRVQETRSGSSLSPGGRLLALGT